MVLTKVRKRRLMWLRAQMPWHKPEQRYTREGWPICPCGRYGLEPMIAVQLEEIYRGILDALDECSRIEDLLQPIQNQYHGKEPWANNPYQDADSGEMDLAIGHAVNVTGALYKLLPEEWRRKWADMVEAGKGR